MVGLVLVMAAIDVLSVAAMLWRNDRATGLLIAWSNFVAIAACLVWVRWAPTDDEVEAVKSTITLSSPGGEVPRQPAENRSGGMPLPAFLDDFPSEVDDPSLRRTS